MTNITICKNCGLNVVVVGGHSRLLACPECGAKNPGRFKLTQIKEAAAVKKVSVVTLHNWISAGHLNVFNMYNVAYIIHDEKFFNKKKRH